MSREWPSQVYLVRHGQSSGNVARDAAELAGLPVIDINHRDQDVPLSELGKQQSTALGQWFQDLPAQNAPELILCSPYLRAQETAELCANGLPILLDERLREREFGILDRLTKSGIVDKFPDQEILRRRVGKFYYRPPGGESWTDVLLRLRSFTEMLKTEYSGRRVAIVCHSVVVLCFRYLFERLTEAQILHIDSTHEIANCSVTSYHIAQGDWRLDRFNYVAPVKEGGAQVTRKNDVPTN